MGVTYNLQKCPTVTKIVSPFNATITEDAALRHLTQERKAMWVRVQELEVLTELM